MLKISYNYESTSIEDLKEIVKTDNFMIFGIGLIGLLFMAFGFGTGFSGDNHLYGLVYYLYLIALIPLIKSFINRFKVYKKHHFFGHKKKFVIDTAIYCVFVILFLLNGLFFNKYVPQESADYFNVFPFEHNYIFILLFIVPMFIIFWFYLDYSIQKKPRKIYQKRLLEIIKNNINKSH